MATIDKNLDNKGNSKGFHKGSEPDKFGPDDIEPKGGEKNKVGAKPEPNEDKNKIYDARLLKPRDPVLNAVPMPNKDKGNDKNYKIFDKISDYPTTVGGTPRPNTIK